MLQRQKKQTDLKLLEILNFDFYFARNQREYFKQSVKAKKTLLKYDF